MASLALWANFNKRRNSTKQPTGSGDAVKTVRLKEGTSLEQPTFVLDGQVHGYNYAQFGGVYYYIDDVVIAKNNITELMCSRDLLATFKSAIQGSSQFVAFYTHNNTEIVDPRLSTKTAITVSSDTESFNNLGTGQSFMLTVVASDSLGGGAGNGGTTVFACDQSAITDLFTDQLLSVMKTDFNNEIDNLINAINAISSGDVFDMLKAIALANWNFTKIGQDVSNTVLYSDEVQQFVKNCYVLPIAPANIGGSSKTIRVGKWDSAASGRKNFPRIVHDSATVSIPWQASDWRRNNPYHEIYLYIPYIGLISIPASEVIGVNSITVNASIDTYSGVTTFVVNAANGTVIGQYSTNIAAQYAVGSANISLVQAGAQVVASAAAIAAGSLSGSPAAVAGGVLGLVNPIKPFDASIGSNSGAAGMGLGNTVKCFTVFHDTTVSPGSVSAVQGTPYNGVLSLSGVSGYVQCVNASVPMAGLGNDKNIINNYLNGGIYIE